MSDSEPQPQDSKAQLREKFSTFAFGGWLLKDLRRVIGVECSYRSDVAQPKAKSEI